MSHVHAAGPLLVRGATDPEGRPYDVLCFDGVQQDPAAVDLLAGVETLGAAGLVVAPGFVDLHALLPPVGDLDPVELADTGAVLTARGTTAWLATLGCPDTGQVRAHVRALAEQGAGALDSSPTSPALGLHLLGPYLPAATSPGTTSPASGAHRNWRRHDGVRMVTLAPELPGAATAVAELHDDGVLVAVGHTHARPAQVRAAADLGARAGTHLLTSMPGIGANAPGPATALLTDQRTALSLDTDPDLVAPEVLDLVWRVLGGHRTALVSGRADGTAGDLPSHLRHLREATRAPLADLLATVTSTPAGLLGEHDRGRLAHGSRADLVLLDPRTLEPVVTVLEGRVVHDAR